MSENCSTTNSLDWLQLKYPTLFGYRNRINYKDGVLSSHQNRGWFSCFNVIRHGLFILLHHKILPSKICFKEGLTAYQPYPEFDFYNLLYQTNLPQFNNFKIN